MMSITVIECLSFPNFDSDFVRLLFPHLRLLEAAEETDVDQNSRQNLSLAFISLYPSPHVIII